MALLAQNTFTLKRLAKDGLSINLGNYSQSVPCNSSGNASAAMTITIPFWGYRGANKVACTCTSPAVGATLVTGVTVSSITNATESAAGSIVLSVASNATFGSSATRSGVFDLVFSVEGETITLQFGWSKAVAGATGAAGKRVVSGLVYYQLASSTAPTAPTATAFDFANNAFTGLTENWALTPPVFEAGNANKFWYVGFYVQETASGGGTGTPAFSTVKQAISFSGLVTFTGDNTVTDGEKTLSFGETGTTEINGDNIKTGKVAAARIDVESLAVLEAFINLLRVKNARTAADGLGAYLEIQSPTEADPVARLKLRGGNAAGYDTYVDIYAENNSADPEITEPDAVLSVQTNTASSAKYSRIKSREIILYSVTGLSNPGSARYYRVYYNNTGIIIQSKVGSAEYIENARLTWDATNGLILKLAELQTINPGTDRVWKDSHGYLKIGDGAAYAEQSHNHTKSQITDFPTSMPASDVSAWAKAASKPSYSASEVGALASDAIQYFTAAEWLALTTAQKNAIPLAVVGE